MNPTTANLLSNMGVAATTTSRRNNPNENKNTQYHNNATMSSTTSNLLAAMGVAATTTSRRRNNPNTRDPTRDEMDAVFAMCRSNQWNSVMNCLRSNWKIAVAFMIMDNHIATTILHQAITSKGDTAARARVIREILDISPKAAEIRNGYGSLPLHVIAQRNTKMDAPTKELLITELVTACKQALVEHGGVGKRTPLHIIFTDYISPRITAMMLKFGQKASFMKDKKGYLPAHVACSRHCSPEKLAMLLDVNPGALSDKAKDGHTLLSLAIFHSTPSHPNYALIADLEKRCLAAGIPLEQQRLFAEQQKLVAKKPSVSTSASMAKSSSGGRRRRGKTTKKACATPMKKARTVRKRKVTEDKPYTHTKQEEEDPATLLLHFSQSHPKQGDTNNNSIDDNDFNNTKKKIKIEVHDHEEDVTLFASV